MVLNTTQLSQLFAPGNICKVDFGGWQVRGSLSWYQGTEARVLDSYSDTTGYYMVRVQFYDGKIEALWANYLNTDEGDQFSLMSALNPG